MKHCKKDEEVTMDVVRNTQTEIIGHMAMLTKVFKMGQNWDQVERVRETVINGSHAVCPMCISYTKIIRVGNGRMEGYPH